MDTELAKNSVTFLDESRCGVPSFRAPPAAPRHRPLTVCLHTHDSKRRKGVENPV